MLKEHFSVITDPRQQGKVKHNLLEIIVMTICAVIAGCDVWDDIADFCRVKERWMRESLHMKLENGIPSHDTLQRVWSMIDPNEFERCFCSWVSTVYQSTAHEIVSIDGKTLRCSGSESQSPLHMVSAWANKNQLVLGQISTDEKSNEITAVPELLEVLYLSGCIVTADAMSCQKAITKKITEKSADYVLSLKDNQPLLCSEVKEYFAEVESSAEKYPEVQRTKTHDKGHGRIETREYYLLANPDWMLYADGWTNLNAIGMVHSKVQIGDEVTEERRYFISSLSDVKLFAKAARAHWGVENSLHWCLDMTFKEDYNRTRKDFSAENMAVVRHIVLDILKQHPAKISIARKRRRCSYDDAFLAEVVALIHA